MPDEKPIEIKGYLTAEQAAEFIARETGKPYSPKTINFHTSKKHGEDGELVPDNRFGNTPLYKERTLRKFLAKRRRRERKAIPSPHGYLSVQEFADAIGISRESVYGYIRRGRLTSDLPRDPADQFAPHYFSFDTALDFEDWLEKRD